MFSKKLMSVIVATTIVGVGFIPQAVSANEGIEDNCGRVEYHMVQGEKNILDFEDVNQGSQGLACSLLNIFDNKLKTIGKVLLSKQAYVDMVKQHVTIYDQKTNYKDTLGSQTLTRYLNRWVTYNYNKINKVSIGTPDFIPVPDITAIGTPDF